MSLIGILLSLTLIFGGFLITEIFFYYFNNRFIWRAFTPSFIRFTIFPEDKVELDCYDVFVEYVYIMLWGSFLVIPFICLNFMGLIN
jgi:hypothetical protein